MPAVLVVQADPALRASWGAALVGHGYAVLAEAEVGAAVERAREGGIDAVLLDSGEPARSARDLVDELGRLPEPPPVILVSSSPKAPELSAHLGAAAFVPKPCTDDELISVVDGVVGARVRRIVLDDPSGPRDL